MSVVTRFFDPFGIVLCSFLLLFFLPLVASAAGLNPAAGDITLLPGNEASISFTLKNTLSEEIVYDIDIIGLDLTGEEIAFTELDEEIASYVRVDRSLVVLDPNSEQSISLITSVPVDAVPGVHTIGMRILEKSRSTNGITVDQGIVAPVFVTLDGPIYTRYQLTNATLSPSFATKLPLDVSLSVQNDGMRVMQPMGNVTIRNMFGRTVDTIPVNEGGKRVLGGEARTFVTSWRSASPYALGVYTFDVDVRMWPNGDVFTQQFKGVVVSVPVVVMLLVAMLLLILIAWVTRVPRKI